MSIVVEKRNVLPFSNVDQSDLDRKVLDERLKQWRNGGRKQLEKDVNWEGAPQLVEDLNAYLKQFNFEEKQAFIKGMLFVKEMHSLPHYKCKECCDTGYVRQMDGAIPLNAEAAKISYMEGDAGSPDGMVCFSAPSKCTEC